jgi:hypothetical protein
MVADLRFLIRVQRTIDSCGRFRLAGQHLLMQTGNAGGDLSDLVGRAGLDGGVQLGVQRMHLLIEAGGGYAMLLQCRMHRVLLGGIQVQSLGEMSFGVRSAGSARSAASWALCEDESSGSGRE